MDAGKKKKKKKKKNGLRLSAGILSNQELTLETIWAAGACQCPDKFQEQLKLFGFTQPIQRVIILTPLFFMQLSDY